MWRKKMSSVLVRLFTVVFGVTIGWVLGTLGFMSSVASLERNAERKESSVKNHPSSRNSDQSYCDLPTYRGKKYNKGFKRIYTMACPISVFDEWYTDDNDNNH
jgi:hypothetical protein